jgi:uncharacterized protein involved in outer membrane biogenesis
MAESFRVRARRILAKRWLRRTAVIFVVLVIGLLLFARYALPGIVRSQAEKILSAQLHRPTTIAAVEIHPLELAFAIHGLKIMEPDVESKATTVFASFDTLAVDLSGQSILHFAPVIQALRLATPYVHLVRTGAGHYNIDDLLQMGAGAPPDKTADQKPPRYSVYNIQIADGKVVFDDRPQKTVHTIADIALAVPFISSLASKVEVFVEPALHARIDDAPLDLKGKALPYAEPREASLDIDFGDLDLPRFVEYLPFEARFKIPTARFDAHLKATFSQASGKSPTLFLEGTAALKSLAVTALDGAPLISLPQLEVTLGKVDLFGDRIEIGRIAFDKPQIAVVQEANGELNLAQLAPPPAAASAAPAAAAAPAAPAAPADSSAAGSHPPTIVIDEISIDGAQVHYEDHTGPAALDGDLDRFGLKVAGTEIDLAHLKIDVHEVTSDSAALALRQAKGVAAARAAPAAAHNRAAAPAPAPAASAPATVVSIGKLAISNWSAHIDDRTMAKPVLTDVSAVTAELHDLTTAPGHVFQLGLSAAINKAGKVAVDGKVGMQPLHAELGIDIESFDVLPLQPYFTDKINLLVTRGALNTKGRLTLDQAASGPLKGGYTGDVSLAGLATIDKVNADPFLDWKSLAVRGIKLQLEPFALTIDQVALANFFARVIIDPTGRLNLQDVSRAGGAQPVSLTTPNAATPAPAAPAPASGPASPATSRPPPIRVAKVTLQGGRVRFTDNFIRPNYSANLADLGGTVAGLSSDPSSAATVDLRGQVNDAPLTIAGTVNPLKGDLFVDLKASVKGMELVPFTPYAGHYLGYGIEKGKLSFDVAYKIENRKLTASNRLVLDQLTFGDKIESPTATSLPVRLAVSLLQDRDGVIDLDLPIGGSLDDPHFSIGGILWHAFINLIEKAVTAPFALLGSMFGGAGGDQMSSLPFDPGVATLTPAATDQLQKLAKALTERPKLKLEVTGRVDADADREGLRRASIDRKVRSLKVRDLVDHGESTDPNTVTVSSDEYPALLARAYKAEKFPKPRNVVGMQKDLPVPEMEKLMMTNATVSDSDLVQLGQQRAEAAASWLEKDGGIAADRVFVVASAPGAPSKAPAAEPQAAEPQPADAGAAAGTGESKPAAAGKPAARVDFSLK